MEEDEWKEGTGAEDEQIEEEESVSEDSEEDEEIEDVNMGEVIKGNKGPQGDGKWDDDERKSEKRMKKLREA